ncbi:radical SAM protein [Fimbriimonas ginsengisoli]|uniref:Molybdenum cofactor biosynthesis protein MoaA n=1 Tax=Fimbriimonas ginsengisoli Gsoil 348 TaxID=661478 RepID=A0A068NW44_FIMGI|nr:radical SAM protein [Fimbriimonas ginsengisoli]AIE87753.1 Molybdenum cofactor biosynthesis protein MoaA [Fimbriimonas ginsengisoli Gsoil 348]
MAGLAARPYRIEEYTRTVCPHCFADRPRRSDEEGIFVDGMLVSHDGKIWMRRWCPTHGETESLYEEDAEIWQARAGWSTPTLAVTPDRPDNFAGFPDGYRDGLPASHGQHTCILLLNVTEHCNFRCPTCYATAHDPGTPLAQPDRPSIAEMLHTVDTVLAREEGKLGVVMVSGGEPTVRRDIEELLERLFERNLTRVMLNTNGRRIARDDRFLKFLQSHRDRVEVYLQFDGFRASTHLALRGEDLSEEKPLALCRLNEAGIFTTLVMTVAKGVNDDEVGEVLTTGLNTPRCAGLAIQPMFGSGRNPGFDPQDRVTPTGVLRRLGAQTRGQVDWQDFVPLPCSHKDCCDITYLLKTRKGWRSLPKLVGRDELKRWIHLVANTISFESASDSVRGLVQSGALQRVFSEQQKVTALGLARDIFTLCDCIPGVAELLRSPNETVEKLAERTFRVTVKQFMDANTFHEARIRQCCVHVGTFEEDPRRHSFCWRWLFEDADDFPKPRVSTLPVLQGR